jgi:hypothetical protein
MLETRNAYFALKLIEALLEQSEVLPQVEAPECLHDTRDRLLGIFPAWERRIISSQHCLEEVVGEECAINAALFMLDQPLEEPKDGLDLNNMLRCMRSQKVSKGQSWKRLGMQKE